MLEPSHLTLRLETAVAPLFFIFFMDNFVYYYSICFKEREPTYVYGFALGTHVNEKMTPPSLPIFRRLTPAGPAGFTLSTFFLGEHHHDIPNATGGSFFLIGWLAGGRDVRPFGREDKPFKLVQCSISWCAVARSCLVQLFVPSEQAKKPGD